ncbi:MAG: beta-carotene hydroxylase [Candidatus Lokiarchaeota archaeon]|nr:beta-carotene hydroxylase [Candidatus Lokiarchaeota archaeon]
MLISILNLPLPYEIIVIVAITIFTAIFMEWFAWFLHKFVMHGLGWYLHEDHHRYTEGRFQKNDLFAVFFSILSFLFIFLGSLYLNLLVWMGIGVAFYGLGYFLFHDIMFHKRIRNHYHPKNNYMKRIFNAHKYHHQTTNRKGSDGKAYGFLYAKKKYTHLSKILKTK